MTMWVFGYGSLLWNPGFPVADRVLARLPDYHRSFCMRSVHHRGTPEKPGLVLALDEWPGAACTGLGLAVAPGAEDETLDYLRERELVSSAYVEKRLWLDLTDGRRVEAVAYVVDAAHEQYCGDMPLEEQAQTIACALGGRGPNPEYLHNTVAHLRQLGIEDGDLEWLDERVRVICG
ncbi:gamma-glutamylcyclotransferase [Lutimaribacter sp. EGI FJ00015]|uniref:Gamma-glutamylcyclotransferase n=1 Tax=Lutimaribacter degradans TaxID=2945989 RepID=A0ACC5ZWD2_9RHOB|nr:gamma-glutamylcyclotransferase [Lutimaribacter sp. EGI FJ00013]MCM2562654.1 gamma-glutamylcyclotransferase [Lutimaribacter sp. EGI FJ00013]MCO0613811.1 gamma-glutamylcyclotransferase [Lutimaribacter sp. EGI FJ00015]MCO0636706.1 gamma-glutamylcyclotransferase [Lutimaribacter sp. EGI FJ00014]